MALKKKSEELREQLEAMRAEVAEIQGMDDPSEDDLARAEALVGDEWDRLEAEFNKALEREKKVEQVVRANLAPANREGGDDSGEGDGEPQVRRTRRGPEILQRVEAYDEDTYKELARSLHRGAPGTVNFEPGPVLDRAKAAVEDAPRTAFRSTADGDAAKEKMLQLLELDNIHAPLIARHMLLTGSPEYREQFREYVQSRGSYAPELLRTAMSLTDGNGGYLVPFFLDPTIILTSAGVTGSMRRIATVKTIATDTWNGVSSAGVTTSWTAEGVETADGSPTLIQPTITPKKADAWVFGSFEVFQDSGFSSELARLLADAKVIQEETAFATANTGATRPRGVVAAVAAVTASIVTAAATNAFAIGDVYNTADAVNPRQEDAPGLAWMAHKKIFSKIRQFDTSGGGGFWANLGVGLPPQLLGANAYKSSPMTSVVSTGANILLVGDFKEYYIVDRIGMSVIYDPLIRSTGNNRPTGQAGWYAFWRVGGDVVNADAFRLLQLNQVAAATALA